MAPIFESNFSIRSILAGNNYDCNDAEMMDFCDANAVKQEQAMAQPNEDVALPPTPPADDENPAYTYAALIIMAIRSTAEKRMLLCNIYDWIGERFPSFTKQRPNWQNQVRHTLSTNSCFVKVPRALDDPGRGNYWAINPAFPGMDIGANNGHLVQNMSIPQQFASNSFGQHHHHAYTQSLTHGVPFKHPLAASAVYFPSPEEIQLHIQQEQQIWLQYFQQQQQHQLYQQQIMQMQQHQG